MRISIISIVLLSTILSCTTNSVEDIVLSESDIKSSIPLEVDTIITDDNFPTVDGFYHYNDSIIIILNEKNENSYFLEFYNCKTDKVVRQLFMLGNGPNEMLSADISINGSKLFVRDCVRQQLAEIDIDKLLQDKKYKVGIDKSVEFGIASFSKIHGEYVFENPYSFVDEKEGIIQDEERLITTSQMKDLENDWHEYNTVNVSSCGNIITNDSLDCIFYTSSSQSLLEIYDKSLTLRKRITGPIFLHTKYIVTDEKEVIFFKMIPYTYVDFCVSKNFVFLNYVGDMVKGPDYSTDSIKSHIMQFDWNGNLIKCYKTTQLIHALSCAYDAKSIEDVFATEIDSKGGYILVRYHEKK